MNAATDNECCAVCRKVRPERYNRCEEACKALVTYFACIAADRFTSETRRSIEQGQLAHDDDGFTH